VTNLSGGGATSLIQTIREILKLVLQFVLLLLDLGSGGTLSLQFLLELLNTSLQEITLLRL